jgi:acetyl esterase/lipase
MYAMRFAPTLRGAAVALLTTLIAAGAAAAPLSYADILARPRYKPSRHIAYGPAADQFGELWLPKGAVPHPVVVLLHGGCWNINLPGLELMDYAAEDLRQRGFAVWNLEYRRLGDGGGYPATFVDVATGVDLLRKLAKTDDLDLKHVVLVGHSAGGQLALWAAARARLPKTSALRVGDPLPVAGVVTLGGIDDLQTYQRVGPEACGGPATITALVKTGRPPGAKAFADTSPAELLPIGVRQTVISGDLDLIVPPIFGADYAAKAAKAGDKVEAVVIPRTGHFDLIDPLSDGWKRVEPLIDQLLR